MAYPNKCIHENFVNNNIIIKHRDYKENCLCGVQYIIIFLLVVEFDGPREKTDNGHLIDCYLSLVDG